MTKLRDVYPLDDTIWSPLSKWLKYLDPLYAVRFIEHFLCYVEANFVVSETGTGTRALEDLAGGWLKVTTGAVISDLAELQLKGEAFKLVSGKPCWFEGKLKVDDALNTDLFIGLAITDADILGGVSDAVLWQKDNGDRNLDFHVIKDSTPTDKTALSTLADGAIVRLGFYFNGKGSIVPYLNGAALAASKIITNIPDDTEITISFGIKTSVAVGKNLSIDFIKCVQQS